MRDTGKHVLPDELGVDVLGEPSGDEAAGDRVKLLVGDLDGEFTDERHDLLCVGALLQIERASACKTPEEILAFAQDEGLELTDEQLEAVAGGKDVNGWGFYGSDWFGNIYCPFCNSTNVQIYTDGVRESYQCKDCG